MFLWTSPGYTRSENKTKNSYEEDEDEVSVLISTHFSRLSGLPYVGFLLTLGRVSLEFAMSVCLYMVPSMWNIFQGLLMALRSHEQTKPALTLGIVVALLGFWGSLVDFVDKFKLMEDMLLLSIWQIIYTKFSGKILKIREERKLTNIFILIINWLLWNLWLLIYAYVECRMYIVHNVLMVVIKVTTH